MALAGAAEKQSRGTEEGETLEALRGCRDHWKLAFEDERRNVIRLRGLVYQCHVLQHGPGGCHCNDCELVRQHRRDKENERRG